MEKLHVADNEVDAPQAVQLLISHVEAQERDRQVARTAGRKYEPSEEQKVERDRLLRQLLAALGCTRAELINRLHIDKATWDRWRGMVTVPQRMHLDALTRFAKGTDGDGEPTSQPRPLDMLAVGRKMQTWGRLKLVYSFFNWTDVIFCFREVFTDPGTVTEIALLALRGEGPGCRVIYLHHHPEEWVPKYVNTLKAVLGEADTARVLSRCCVVKIPEAALLERGFGLFNYEATDKEKKVGYQWFGDAERPIDTQENVYEPLSAGSTEFSYVKDNFEGAIKCAFDVIADRKRELPDFWELPLDSETKKALLKIPVIDSTNLDIRDQYLDPTSGQIKRRSDES